MDDYYSFPDNDNLDVILLTSYGRYVDQQRDQQKRFNSEYRKKYFEFQPERPEDRTEFIIEDGNIVNPYLQKRRRGRKIIKNNPVYQKDTADAGRIVEKNLHHHDHEFKTSTTNKFNQELQAQGYMNHSNKIPASNASKYNSSQYSPNETTSTAAKQEQRPYKREAGRSLIEESFHNNQNTSMEARNINRRIVENNIVKNTSIERQRAEENNTREDKLSPENQYNYPQDKHDSNKLENFYQNASQNPTKTDQPGEGHPNISHFKEGSNSKNPDNSQNHTNFYPSQEMPNADTSLREIEESLPNQVYKNNNFRSRGEKIQGNNSMNLIPKSTKIKYEAPQVQKSVNFADHPPQMYQDQVSETYSRMGDK